MLADSQTSPICRPNFIKIGPFVSEEFGNKLRDTRILYIKVISDPNLHFKII